MIKPLTLDLACASWDLQEVDWEVEMAFVIGRRGKHIKVITDTALSTEAVR